ncbi:MAG: tRNA 2-selenouridine(34) synthase MnmH [Sulfurospirillaceae bacterium]|nr:tRNA 2-selenouridine(34) synthase MnmH [Sulfurospirillaceae bacterium]
MLKIISTEDFLDDLDEFDIIIDARSPKEYHHSKIPNAVNLYALSDSEHQEVGYIYKQLSKNDAKLKGASYICLNASRHVFTLSNMCKIGSKIAIYCARGGLRSASLATIFSNIGYRVYKLEFGYKGYRNAVVDYLENFNQIDFIVLGGNTGCGKSELLQNLANSIDLEALANHLGSTFGSVKGVQPTQKEFQNRLHDALRHVDKTKPVFIEGESKRIGSIILPDLLYKKMGEGMRVEITAPIGQRVERILKDYINIDDDFFYRSMEKITPYIKKSAKSEAIKFYQEKNLAKVAEILLLDYYDNVYKKPEKIDISIDNSDISVTLSRLHKISKVKK